MLRNCPPVVLPFSLLMACGDQGPAELPEDERLGFVAADSQRAGDPMKGYRALLNEGYVGCGIPSSAYFKVFSPAPQSERLPGREGKNAELPYYLTAFTTRSGVEVVSPNCLACHAGSVNGQLIVGLGDSTIDMTQDQSVSARLAGGLITDPVERMEWSKFVKRMETVAPYSTASTIGVNTADNLAGVLFAHRDRKTLAWSDEPLLPLPDNLVVPVDTPPWWRMQKKHAMFYDAAGRGDHARIMMTASTLCVDTVEEAQAIDTYFPDVRAYIYSLQPPRYPFPIDSTLAAQGRGVFNAQCSRCHGTYASGADAGSYPNLVIGIAEVGTDPVLVQGAGQFAGPFVDWFNGSFYGQIAKLTPAKGYIAPPLDGIWATAPYLHNGSVPTIAALLESSTRPRYWTRTMDSKDYDPATLGWRFTTVDHGQQAEPSATQAARIYDTTLSGYSSSGHQFGDALSASDRLAVIEYLKTL